MNRLVKLARHRYVCLYKSPAAVVKDQQRVKHTLKEI